jgi:hypothetical protein
MRSGNEMRKKKKKGDRKEELTLINILCRKNESKTWANFKGQLIMGLSNYTGEFTNDFFKGRG